jgi:capsular exopolysaccharide synthesis family protein
VLAAVPRGDDTDRSVVEAFRTLRTSLAAMPGEYRPSTIAVTSAQAGAGKSFTAINLARASAAQQSGVLLVDADLRRPVIHERLDIAREPGVTNVLMDGNTRGALHSVGVSAAYSVGEPRRFLVMPSGPPVPDPVVVLSGDAISRILATVDEHPHLTVVDTPPAALFGDATAVAAQCSAAIVIIDARKSRVRATRNVITVLTRSGANIIGLVVNRVSAPRTGRYYES